MLLLTECQQITGPCARCSRSEKRSSGEGFKHSPQFKEAQQPRVRDAVCAQDDNFSSRFQRPVRPRVRLQRDKPGLAYGLARLRASFQNCRCPVLL